jgi:hypothetical protein
VVVRALQTLEHRVALDTGSQPYTAMVTMPVYTVIFGFIATRYFRWE